MTDGPTSKSVPHLSNMDSSSAKRKPWTRPPQFNLPKLKKIKRDLLTDLQLDSHECQYEILAAVTKSFHFRESSACHEFLKVQAVHNPELTGKYLERRKEMKNNGYPDAMVADTYAFVAIDKLSSAEKICKEGLHCGNQQTSALGVPPMAVHLCKHADVLTPSKPKPGERMMLVVKVVKGKLKTVLCKNASGQLEPTPNFDCHVAKTNVDQAASLPPHMFFFSTQLYVYEYGDFDLEEYPRQILPFAVVCYRITDPQVKLKPVSSQPQLMSGPGSQLYSSAAASESSSAQGSGPGNEVWRGRLHVRLIEGGHIYIEVSIFSSFVPLTVSLISPIKIHSLYPEHNAQFTFFAGLSNIAQTEEVEWREHFFRSCMMRPRLNNEEHFKALVKHISAKREIPAVRLPNDVFMFLMPNSLLSSQLGFVRWEESSPVLHCVVMSKFSTIKAEEKKLSKQKKMVFHNFGRAPSFENLFDDSDFSDTEDESVGSTPVAPLSSSQISSMFKSQRGIHNKFAAMSIADADVNFAPCACRKLSVAKSQHQRHRDDDVKRVLAAVHSAVHPSQKTKSHFPSGSRQKPKQRMSRRAREMPSFSPHGSSESDSDSKESGESRRTAEKRKQDRYSLLHSTKTVEEELSEEEELTNEQMDAIIFLRKPTLSSSTSALKNKPSKPVTQVAPEPMPSQFSHSNLDQQKSHKDPSLSLRLTPKIIPTEPTEQARSDSNKGKDPGRPGAELVKAHPKIIPAEPVVCVGEPLSSSDPEQARVAATSKTSHDGTGGHSYTSAKPSKSSVSHKNAPQPLSSKSKTDISTNLSGKMNQSRPTPNTSSLHTSSKSAQSSDDFAQSSHFAGSKVSRSAQCASNVSLHSNVKVRTPSHGHSDTLHHIRPKPARTQPSDVQFGASSKPVETCPELRTTSSHRNSPKQMQALQPQVQNDFEDVDMRLPHSHIPQIHPAFLSAPTTTTSSSPFPPAHSQQLRSCLKTSPRKLTVPSKPKPEQLSPNLSCGSWLAPSELPNLPPASCLDSKRKASENEELSSGQLDPHDAPSPVSLPDESPPSPAPIASPVDSPASPAPSPASPPSPSPLDSSESPESPPQSAFAQGFRSSPIAIPTDRIKLNASPEVNYRHIAYSPSMSYTPNGAAVPVSREGIDSIEDMKDFLNAGFDSDLDSSYDDDSDTAAQEPEAVTPYSGQACTEAVNPCGQACEGDGPDG